MDIRNFKTDSMSINNTYIYMHDRRIEKVYLTTKIYEDHLIEKGDKGHLRCAIETSVNSGEFKCELKYIPALLFIIYDFKSYLAMFKNRKRKSGVRISTNYSEDTNPETAINLSLSAYNNEIGTNYIDATMCDPRIACLIKENLLYILNKELETSLPIATIMGIKRLRALLKKDIRTVAEVGKQQLLERCFTNEKIRKH